MAYYIAKYISKSEPSGVQEEIKKMIQQMQGNDKGSHYQMAQKIAMLIMNKRQVGAPEAAYRLCHLKLRQSSRGFVFIPAYLPSKRLHIFHKETLGSGNVKVGMSLVEKYCQRPDEIKDICLLEFAATFTPYRKVQQDDYNSDDSEQEEEENINHAIISLKNGTKMKRRKREAIVKYPNFDPISQKDDYYYCLLLLYLPFQEENFVEQNETIPEAFRRLNPSFRNHSHADYLRVDLAQEIDRALVRMQNFDVTILEGDGDDPLPENFEEDNDAPEPGELFQPPAEIGSLHERYQTLSQEQKEVFNEVLRKLNTQTEEHVLSFISGSGGTGKSYLIDTLSALIKSFERPNTLLKAAPTGIAALNINATTLHRAFKLPVQRGYIPPYTPLNAKNLEEMRVALREVKWIIIDEISMVSYEYLRIIHLRQKELFRDNDKPFSGINFLVFGDLMQFRPVNGSWIFQPPAKYSHEMNLWTFFKFHELTTNHRQSGDARYLELLERLRFGQCTRDDLTLLQSRIFDTENIDDVVVGRNFAEAIALFPNGAAVNEFNEGATEKLKTKLAESGLKTYNLIAEDYYAAGSKFDQRVDDKLVPNHERLTGGFPKSLEIGVGSRVMLRRNTSLVDGLVNGSVGTVKGIKWTGLREEPLRDGDLPECLIVHFDGNAGGRRKDINGYVKIECRTVEFVGKRQTLIKRRMLPVILCYAIVFHKCQGLTLHFASIDLARRHFAKAMAYVALSRLKTSEGLHLIAIKDSNVLTIKANSPPCDDDAVKELFRLRLMKIGMQKEDVIELLDWVVEFVECNICKKWVCGACKC